VKGDKPSGEGQAPRASGGHGAGGHGAGPAAGSPTAVSRILGVLLPIIGALVVGAIILAAAGRNPLAFYGDLFRAGLVSSNGWQAMLTRLAPLLLISTGYIVAFRAGLWNIGGDGQFLLAAAVVAGAAPAVMGAMPRPAGLVILAIIGFVVGGAWTLLPAYLKAWHSVNEIITTVMMSFIGINLAYLLIREVWRTDLTITPETTPVPLDQLLPRLGNSTVHAGILLAVVVVGAAWYVLSRTSVGLRLTVLGASPRAAVHAGLNVRRLVVATFFVSGGLVGLAGAIEILGVWGYMRAGWNPQFGLALFALVFLARLHPAVVIPLAGFYAVLQIGGHHAAQQASLDYDFILILIALMLFFMALWQYFRNARGGALSPKAGERP
jgi:general nucleoside transport system permease protein